MLRDSLNWVNRGGHAAPRLHDLRHYPESRNMPRRIGQHLASRGGWRSLLGIVSSPTTLRGATGDDYDSDIQGPVPRGAEGFTIGVHSGFC
ncbi:MAG: hypothetical protein CO071_02545 [Gallionellales bacterium CG_4_9_14_0_8_um_filter_59_50]|nr:MAG: hypothetical protein CO071_02545 [Gallionellales bacterium CG_4_9_14_0_8_um_filter_59_50]